MLLLKNPKYNTLLAISIIYEHIYQELARCMSCYSCRMLTFQALKEVKSEETLVPLVLFILFKKFLKGSEKKTGVCDQVTSTMLLKV